MKAWVLESNIGVDGLTLLEQPSFPVLEQQVRVKIKACGINNRDLFIADGVYYRPIPYPCILGSDIVGEIIEVGREVYQVEIGDRVLLFPIIGCQNCEKCHRGIENECSNYDSLLGGLAEEIVIDAKQCIRLPEYFSNEEAAGIPIAYLTAWNMLYTKAKVKGDETILFWGATSGVGTAGLLLYNNPEKSIPVVGSEEKAELLKAHGFINCLYYRNPDFEAKLFELTNHEGVDVIFDPVGAAAWDKNLDYLKNNGIHVNCARNTGSIVEIDLAKLFAKQISIYGAKTGTRDNLQSIISKLEKNNRKPIIDKVFSFYEVKEALLHLKTNKQIGKVVVKHDEN